MVKQIAIILILSFLLSLMPDFLYTETNALAGCPDDCDIGEKDGKTYCFNCPIKCEWALGTTENFSAQPLTGTGEWACGTEIPIGEVIENSSVLGAKMLGEFQGIIENSEIMLVKTDEILDDYKEWNCAKDCETKCHKYYHITEGMLQDEQDWQCPTDAANVPRSIYAGDECEQNVSQCKSCEDCKEMCCWQETYPIVEDGKKVEIINCKYCHQLGSCEEMCNAYSCSGCCKEYFDPIIQAYSDLENLPEALKNDIEEKYIKEEKLETLPDNFKCKRSYILDQLEFSRCQLAQCRISAENWYKCLYGEIICSRLVMAKTASQLDLFDDDQFISSVLQIIKEEEITKKIWGYFWETPEHWWEIPLIPFKFFGKTINLSWTMVKNMLDEKFETGKEEGCYPFNYYCCEL